jgi:hypothetical protein
MDMLSNTYTAFDGFHRLATGALAEVAVAAKRAISDRPDAAILVFSDRHGSVLDLDLRGDEGELRRRYAPRTEDVADHSTSEDHGAERGRGRPRLGVVAREVTLLPRHWEWLATQPGGVSAALRRLVEDARKSRQAIDFARARCEATYRVMAAMAGNLPSFEEASRALFARDDAGFRRQVAKWPDDLRQYVLLLAGIPVSEWYQDTKENR